MQYTYSGLQFNFLRSEFKFGTGAGTEDTGKIFLSCVRFTGLKPSGCWECCRLNPPKEEDSWFTPGYCWKKEKNETPQEHCKLINTKSHLHNYLKSSCNFSSSRALLKRIPTVVITTKPDKQEYCFTAVI